MCERVVSEDSLSVGYVSDLYKTQKMSDKAIDDSLAALKFVSNWFVTSKIIKKLYAAWYVDENILYFNEDSGNAVFSSYEMGNSAEKLLFLLCNTILKISYLIIILWITLEKGECFDFNHSLGCVYPTLYTSLDV